MSKPKKSKGHHLPSCVREALAMFEALRRLGYESDDIFCAHYTNQTAIVLKRQGMEFIITCGSSGMSAERFHKLWNKAASLWNGTNPGLSTEDREDIFEGSIILKKGGGFVGLVAMLQAKGFDVPFMEQFVETDGREQAMTELSFVNSKGGQA